MAETPHKPFTTAFAKEETRFSYNINLHFRNWSWGWRGQKFKASLQMPKYGKDLLNCWEEGSGAQSRLTLVSLLPLAKVRDCKSKTVWTRQQFPYGHKPECLSTTGFSVQRAEASKAAVSSYGNFTLQIGLIRHTSAEFSTFIMLHWK